MNLSVKLTLVFSGIVLLMGAISFYGIYSFQNNILEQEITDKLEAAAVANLDRLDRMFFERLEDLDALVDTPIFTSNKSTPEQIRRELEKFSGRHSQYASLSYFDMNRMLIATLGATKTARQRHSLSEYWPAVYKGENHIVNVSMSETLKMPTIHLVTRVMDSKGKDLGVLVARVPVEALYELAGEKIEADSNAKKYKVDILDRDGTILYSTHNKPAILSAMDDDFELIKDAIPSVRSVASLTHTHQRFHEAEEQELMVFAKEQGYQSFKGNGWILKIEYASENAFAPVVALGKKVSMILLLTSLLGIVTILAALSYMVVRPIRKLNNATTQLGHGELDTRVVVESSDEIGQLDLSFNEMAENLKVARGQLAHAVETALARANLAERKIINISEETQQQIGRELHDDLGQQLAGVAFMCEVLCQHLKKQNHAGAESASRITMLINDAILKTNTLAHGLYPVEMKESGLSAMLKRLAGNTELIYHVECGLICEGEFRIDTPLAITNLFRITQEAVHNAVKHSGATKITLRMITTPDAMTIEVEDNGRGIGNRTEAEATGGLGMHTMQYRAALLGATLSIAAVSSGGTRVRVSLPAINPSLQQ